jgi:hypothetical protein
MRTKGSKPKKLTEEDFEEVLTRLTNLELRVDALDRGGFMPEPSSTKRRGPKPRISDDELFEFRDGLALWLEEIWPDLVKPLLSRTGNPEAVQYLRTALRLDDPAGFQVRPFQIRLVENMPILFEFVASKYFKRRPSRTHVARLHPWRPDPKCYDAAAQFPTRQIANAMAGVPELSWRRSLDRCVQEPCPWPVRLKTENYFRSGYSMPAIPFNDDAKV